MKILIIGSTGTIGSQVVAQLSGKHEIITANRSSGDFRIELGAPQSIQQVFAQLSGLDAVVSVAGPCKYGSLMKLSDADFQFGFDQKFMGQVNLLRYGLRAVKDTASFTFTGGMGSRYPEDKGFTSIAAMNAALEGFVRAAALELPPTMRVNVVAPPWVTETREALGMDKSIGLPAVQVAKLYVEVVEGSMTGQVIDAHS
jgi:NAD(P)-dependent dehydrogenase (short-subunit alcohol dehydrogenase family)